MYEWLSLILRHAIRAVAATNSMKPIWLRTNGFEPMWLKNSPLGARRPVMKKLCMTFVTMSTTALIIHLRAGKEGG